MNDVCRVHLGSTCERLSGKRRVKAEEGREKDQNVEKVKEFEFFINWMIEMAIIKTMSKHNTHIHKQPNALPHEHV